MKFVLRTSEIFSPEGENVNTPAAHLTVAVYIYGFGIREPSLGGRGTIEDGG